MWQSCGLINLNCTVLNGQKLINPIEKSVFIGIRTTPAPFWLKKAYLQERNNHNNMRYKTYLSKCRECWILCLWRPLSGPLSFHKMVHYSDVIVSAMVSQITDVSMVYSTVCPGANQTKHQSYASLAFVRGIYRWPVNSPHKGPVTRKMFPFDFVIIFSFSILSHLIPFFYSCLVMYPSPHRAEPTQPPTEPPIIIDIEDPCFGVECWPGYVPQVDGDSCSCVIPIVSVQGRCPV